MPYNAVLSKVLAPDHIYQLPFVRITMVNSYSGYYYYS